MSFKIVLLFTVAAAVACLGKATKTSCPAAGENGQSTTTPLSTTTCPAGEIANTCSVDCPSDYCPASEAQSSTRCPAPSVCPTDVPICKCGLNERRAYPGGPCISVYDCPKFDCSARPNEVYNPCPPQCPTDDCLYAPYNGACPPLGVIGTILICNPSCTCAEGFWRNNGTCIPRDQCPNIQAGNSS